MLLVRMIMTTFEVTGHIYTLGSVAAFPCRTVAYRQCIVSFAVENVGFIFMMY